MSAPGWPTGALAPTLGIYGGTFNPIHLGHLRAAEEVAEALALARIVFVPSARPPHKGETAQLTGQAAARAHQGEWGERGLPETIAAAELRLAWVRAAIAGNPRFEADPIEVERAGPSYLVDTLAAFGERLAPRKPVFVLGRDAFCDMGSWREPRRLLTLAHFAVTTRPPDDDGTLADWLPDRVLDSIELAPDGLSGRHREAGTCVRRVAITALDISASDVRRRIRQGDSVRYLVPEVVREAVEASGVYAEGSGEAGREHGSTPSVGTGTTGTDRATG